VIHRNVTLAGAGNGTGAGDTILDGQGVGPVISIDAGLTVTIRGLRITGGAATTANGHGVFGGGVFSNATYLEMRECTIAGNTAAVWGGGLYTSAAQINDPDVELSLFRCHVENNTAFSSGGGIAVAQTHMRVLECTVTNNVAAQDGGGIYNRNEGVPQPAVIDSTLIAGNTGQIGGGIRNFGPLEIYGSQVISNAATGLGGGIFNLGGTIRLFSSNVTGNTPDNCGGASPYEGPGCAAP
jgi:hypothetical protein